MKVSTGFISNSSSSSFLIFGYTFSEDESKEISEKIGCEDDVEEIAEKLGLDSIYGQEDEYVGLSWDCIGDDETGRQFKDRIENAIRKYLPNAKCHTFEESWYDG